MCAYADTWRLHHVDTYRVICDDFVLANKRDKILGNDSLHARMTAYAIIGLGESRLCAQPNAQFFHR